MGMETETDVDAYFAQHDIPSMFSEMLFQLGSQRPKQIGRFMATYLDRRFQLDLAEKLSDVQKTAQKEEEFETIHVHTPSLRRDDSLAAAFVAEARSLRRKYAEFKPLVGEQTYGAISWAEFRTDYERFLLLLASPQLWSFCDRRLAFLRGLFDAHVALNGRAEDVEISSRKARRVDNCVQLARSLPRGRLLDLFHEKVRSCANMEIQGRTLAGMLQELGRPPLPEDLTADADGPLPGAELCGAFSRGGELLAASLLASFKLLEKTDAYCDTYAEYRLPVHAESGAWADLARWVEDFSVASPRVRWIVQLPQAAYSELKERRSVLSFSELLENAFEPLFDPDTPLSQLLECVDGFEVAAVPGQSEVLTDAEPHEWTAVGSPPYAYQLYHVWTRTKILNAHREEAGLRSFSLHSSASTLEPLAAGFLLGASGFSRCGALVAHSPLQYLCLLDGIRVSVSLASRRSLGGPESARGLSQLIKAGVAATLCSEDPAVSQQSDDALGSEYSLAGIALGLSQTDLAEMMTHSLRGSFFSNTTENTSQSIRDRYRAGRRAAEETLIESLIQLSAGALGDTDAVEG